MNPIARGEKITRMTDMERLTEPSSNTPSASRKTGLLLVNLGTPKSPEIPDVREYLKEFLSDPRVLDMPSLARAMLLHGVILRKRPKESSKAYKEVWTDDGSPLLLHGKFLRDKVRKLLSPANIQVELGMRYQSPSLESALNKLRDGGVTSLVVFPLYPQYSSACTASSIEEIFRVLSKWQNIPAIRTVEPYYNHPAYIRAQSEIARPLLKKFNADQVLFSFHGLPESQILKASENMHCLQSADCCNEITGKNSFCYRAHCMSNAKSLADALQLSDYKVAFQSRLGKAKWIEPYTTDTITSLAKTSCKRLAVLCPAFTADCLETIEEIGMQGKEDFLAAGGEDFLLVPCLNSESAWASSVVDICGLASPSHQR